MSEEKDVKEEFILKDGKGLVSVVGKHWRADRIYLSDVCLAVAVKPNQAQADVDLKENASREELYALLRGISNRALDHDLMRPLACFITGVEDKTALEEIKSWGSDQDWHRGAFTLYLLDKGEELVSTLEPTLEELLAPMPELLEVNYDVKGGNSGIMKKVRERLAAPHGELSSELKVLLSVLEESVVVPEKKEEELENRLTAWFEGIQLSINVGDEAR